jgi:hypothetical protein
MIPPIKLLCEMNDIILNWRKINKLMPHGNDNAADEAYTREQIKKMLEYSDLRAKIPILFMASSGMRLGGFQGLTDGCITPVHDDEKVESYLLLMLLSIKEVMRNMILLSVQKHIMHMKNIAIYG